LSGKRVAEGGLSSLGLDPAGGKPLVGLFCVTRAEFQTSSVCGGKIGKAGPMCVAKECGVSGSQFGQRVGVQRIMTGA
jgi:hypothetical protein